MEFELLALSADGAQEWRRPLVPHRSLMRHVPLTPWALAHCVLIVEAGTPVPVPFHCVYYIAKNRDGDTRVCLRPLDFKVIP